MNKYMTFDHVEPSFELGMVVCVNVCVSLIL